MDGTKTYSPPPSPRSIIVLDSVLKRFGIEIPTHISPSGTPASVEDPFSNEKVDRYAKVVLDAFMAKRHSPTTDPTVEERFESVLWMLMVVKADGTPAKAKDAANTQLPPRIHLDPFLTYTEALLRRYPPDTHFTDLFTTAAKGIDDSTVAQEMCDWWRSSDQGFDEVIDSLRWYFATAPPAMKIFLDSKSEAKTSKSGVFTSTEDDSKGREMIIELEKADDIRGGIYNQVLYMYREVFKEVLKRFPVTTNALQPSS